jgi:protoheme ferro-lyase
LKKKVIPIYLIKEYEIKKIVIYPTTSLIFVETSLKSEDKIFSIIQNVNITIATKSIFFNLVKFNEAMFNSIKIKRNINKIVTFLLKGEPSDNNTIVNISII